MSEQAYQALRERAADTSRRLYVYWRNTVTGLDCKAIGPQSMCFCGHRYCEHDWEAFDSRRVRCKMPGCSCTCFNYVPVRGAQDLLCSVCKRSFREHRPDHGCPTGGGHFASSYTCSCTGTYNEHTTVFESRAEREQAGRPVDAGWMEQASREGLPVCHLGGVIGFASLADGVDRVMAGLESDDVSQAVAARGVAVGDAGAQRFLGRCMLEDEVNTASLVHGRAAGHQVIAKARAKRQAAASAGASNSTSGSRQPAIASAPRISGSGGSGPDSSVTSGAPRANVHTLGGPLPSSCCPGPPSRESESRRPKAVAAAAEQRGPLPKSKASPAPRRSSASVPVPTGGRRLGGVRHYDQDTMREARLARLDG